MLDCDKYDVKEGVNLKKLAIVILALATLVAGCAKPPINTRIQPLAYIDSVSSPEIYYGDMVKFTGHGVSTTGEIVAYSWRSSVNGEISKLATFEINTLSAGTHTIWFMVQDNYGNWSNEVGTNLNVLIAGGPTKMKIITFTSNPGVIREGEMATLIWDVVGEGMVRITPDVGDVPQSGSRAVRPLKDTIYLLVANNNEGSVSVTTLLTVTTLPIYTLQLYSVAAEDGTVRKDKTVLEQVLVGQNEMNTQMQAFLSYDISSLPPDAIVRRVELDLSNCPIFGSPFPWLGSMNIYNQQYGPELKSSAYSIWVPAGYLYSWNYNFVATLMPDRAFSSPDMADAVQRQLDNGNKRFQIRIQFEKYYYYTRPAYTSQPYADWQQYANYVDIGAGNPKLIVRYVLPDK